jgi:hypothetical protein
MTWQGLARIFVFKWNSRKFEYHFQLRSGNDR